MSDLPTKHEDVEVEELPSIVNPSDQDQKNNMLRTMAVRSTLGKIQRDSKARY